MSTQITDRPVFDRIQEVAERALVLLEHLIA
jgi:hypothetical protein